jgi:hypothetical protein
MTPLGLSATSLDGISWSSQTLTGGDTTWYSVCWSPELGKFCAVGTNAGGGTYNFMTSSDGTAWSYITLSGYWFAVCWAPELKIFCAVGESGKNATSSDGVTWATHTAVSSNTWRSIVWSPELGQFCVVGMANSAPNIMTSSDGITWATQTCSDDSYQSVCWSPELGIFCAGANGGNHIALSTQVYNQKPSTISSATNYITNTTASASTSTGSLVVSGGAGIAKSLYVGGTTTSTLASTGALVVTGGVGIITTTDAVSATNGGGLTCAGGASFNKTVYVGGTTQSTSSTTGSLIVSGGMGIAKSVFVGGAVNISDTTESTSSTTGSLIVSGGMGIAKSLYVGGSVYPVQLSASITAASTQTINAGTYGQITFGTTNWDNSATNYMTSTTANALTIPITGKYRVEFFADVANTGAGIFAAYININSTTYTANRIAGPYQVNHGGAMDGYAEPYYTGILTAGDIIRVFGASDGTRAEVIGTNRKQTLVATYFSV